MARRPRKKPVIVTRATIVSSLQTASELHRAGQLDEAGALYRRILGVSPGLVDALNGLAMIEYQGRRFDAALALLDRVVARVNDNPGFFMNLGAVAEAALEFERGEVAYRRAIDLAPRYVDPYYNLGNLYLKQHQPDRAVQVFDACMEAVGREFHALAYKALALREAGREEEAEFLLDVDRLVVSHRFDPPPDYESTEAFASTLAGHIKGHSSLRANVLSTVGGEHTGELLRPPVGPMRALAQRIDEAVTDYAARLPADPEHPMVRWAPQKWRLTGWGVVLESGGHERPHIHPNGWLSGVLYAELPDVVDDTSRSPEGWLEIGRPTVELSVTHTPVVHHLRPEIGQMFLFPSYFYHGTVPFESDQPRVCIAFDVEPG